MYCRYRRTTKEEEQAQIYHISILPQLDLQIGICNNAVAQETLST